MTTSLFDLELEPASTPVPCPSGGRDRTPPPRRTARYEDEPGFHEPSGLWLYGNTRLLHGPLAYVVRTLDPATHLPDVLESIEREAEELVLSSKILVTCIHNAAHQRAAIVPLRWGAPRIVCLSGGFHHHLGPELKDEAFRAARLWRYAWDPKTDLAISRRAPDKLPTFGLHNPSADRLMKLIAMGEHPGMRLITDSLTPLLSQNG